MMAKSPAAVAAAFSNSSQTDVPRRELLGGDPRPDDDCRQEGAAQELRDQAPPQRDFVHRTLAPPTGTAQLSSRSDGCGRPSGDTWLASVPAQPSVEQPRPVSSGASARTV